MVLVSSNIITSVISAETALPCATSSFANAGFGAPFFIRCFATMPRKILLFASRSSSGRGNAGTYSTTGRNRNIA